MIYFEYTEHDFENVRAGFVCSVLFGILGLLVGLMLEGIIKFPFFSCFVKVVQFGPT